MSLIYIPTPDNTPSVRQPLLPMFIRGQRERRVKPWINRFPSLIGDEDQRSIPPPPEEVDRLTDPDGGENV